MEVPRLRRQVLPTTGPAVRARGQAPALDTAVANLDTATEEVARVRALDQAKMDRAELVGLEAKLATWENQQIFDPEKGALSRKGADALALREQYLPEFDKAADQIGGNIVSPRVRAAFDELRTQRRTGLDRSLGRYVGEQREVYFDTQDAAQLQALDDSVARNPLDPETRRTAIDRKRWTINQQLDRKGIKDPTARQVALTAAESATHRRAIAGMVSAGSYSQAASYFTENRGGMTDADIAAVDGPVREGQVRALSQSAADDLVAKHGAGAGALTAARSIEDPDVRKAVETDIRGRISDARMLQNLAEEQAADRAWDIIERTGKIKDVPADVWMTVPGPTREAIRNTLDKGTKRVTDADGYRRYYDLEQLAGNPQTRDAFARMDLFKEAFPHMGVVEFKELSRLQAGLRKSDKQVIESLDGVQSRAGLVDRALRSINIDPAAKSGTDLVDGIRFRNRLDAEVVALQSEKGRKASTTEVQEIVDRLIQRHVFERDNWFDETRYGFEITAADVVPAAEVEKIAAALRRAGRPVTDANVIALYQRKVGNGGQ